MLSFFKKILLLKQLLGAGMSREEKNNKKLDLRVNRKHRKHSSCFNLFWILIYLIQVYIISLCYDFPLCTDKKISECLKKYFNRDT